MVYVHIGKYRVCTSISLLAHGQVSPNSRSKYYYIGFQLSSRRTFWHKVFQYRLINKKVTGNNVLIFDQNCRECPKALFFKILAFFFFILFKIHVSIWLRFFVSLGSVVLMLLGTKEGRIFFSFQNVRKKSYFFLPPPLYGKREELESSGQRHSKEEIKVLKENYY